MIKVPHVVGLTGGIGSGKSTVARLFAERGVQIVDTDEIAHALTAPGGAAIDAVQKQFGADVIQADGAMNRSRMRAHVFGSDAVRLQLQAILHPLIRSQSEQQVMAATSAYVMLVVPLLFESGRWQETTRRTLVVDCLEQEQIERVQQRSALSVRDIRAIMDKQMGRSERLALADDVIVNTNATTPADLAAQVETLHQNYLRQCQTP